MINYEDRGLTGPAPTGVERTFDVFPADPVRQRIAH
jgi:hypothetical protein